MHDDRDHVISVVLTHEDWKEFVKLQPQPSSWLRERIQETIATQARQTPQARDADCRPPPCGHADRRQASASEHVSRRKAARPRGLSVFAEPALKPGPYFCGCLALAACSEYDVRLITRMSGRFTFTSILRVRFSGSGLVDE